VDHRFRRQHPDVEGKFVFTGGDGEILIDSGVPVFKALDLELAVGEFGGKHLVPAIRDPPVLPLKEISVPHDVRGMGRHTADGSDRSGENNVLHRTLFVFQMIVSPVRSRVRTDSRSTNSGSIMQYGCFRSLSL